MNDVILSVLWLVPLVGALAVALGEELDPALLATRSATHDVAADDGAVLRDDRRRCVESRQRGLRGLGGHEVIGDEHLRQQGDHAGGRGHHLGRRGEPVDRPRRSRHGAGLGEGEGHTTELAPLGVLEGVLAESPFVAGEVFTIADIAHFGWLWRREFAGISFDEVPHVARWYGAMASRPAVERAIARVNALAPAP